jgi:hypothetical protein
VREAGFTLARRKAPIAHGKRIFLQAIGCDTEHVDEFDEVIIRAKLRPRSEAMEGCLLTLLELFVPFMQLCLVVGEFSIWMLTFGRVQPKNRHEIFSTVFGFLILAAVIWLLFKAFATISEGTP